jgi:hypothetical protein
LDQLKASMFTLLVNEYIYTYGRILCCRPLP